ncbi:MAG TPA: flagellar biosynthesis protein FlhB [Xanthobacteraceae bacterium]|nr:flagellar biosynthesis protein FlhB [Xanthobacteraceae bacterium]
MADERDDAERTEDPTQKRLDDALERGDVAKSQEVNTWFVLGAGLLALFAFGGAAMNGLRNTLAGVLGNAHAFAVDSRGLLAFAERLGTEVLAALAIPLLLFALAGAAGNLIQHRLVWTAKSMQPKLERISPIAGAKRLFSKQALVNFAKGLAKLGLIGALMLWLLWPDRERVDGLVEADVTAIMPLVQALALKLLATVVAALAIVAALDYAYQYHVWFNRQKMSLREIKEEFKQTEGDPHIKAKIRQLRHSRMRKRMMAAVPTASVVITNPTHYAVALKYEPGMNAPVCLAKGVDALALKIREIATEHAVPVVENPPLARALHATVEIDQEISLEHYKAVAEVIGYILRLRRRVMR